MRALLQDLRYALRQMRHAPGFSISVIVVLALGIGANAAMFTVLEGTLFRPLPYRDAGALVHLGVQDEKGNTGWTKLADEQVWSARSHTLQSIAYYNSGQGYLNAQGADAVMSEQRVAPVLASANLFATLGVSPKLGRCFTEQEQQPGKEHVVVLSDSAWRAQFHADKNVLGKTVRIDDVPTTVIGVMPEGFVFPADNYAISNGPQIWQPAAVAPKDLGRSFEAASFQAVGRRARKATVADVAAELTTIQKQLVPLYTERMAADLAPAHVVATDYRRSLDGKEQRTALLALLGAVGVLWLIACANVACLMLARTAARRREMAVRAALGASRWRLVRQTLAESLLLALSGGLAGVALALLALRIFRDSLTTQLDAGLSLRPDARVLLALLVLSVLSAVLFGVVPSWIASGMRVEQALRQDGAQSGTGRKQHRLQRALVVAELAMTLALLVCCGLLLRTVFALRQVPLGFRTEHVFMIEPHLPGYKYQKLDANTEVYRPLLDKLKAIPGVAAAAITTVVPLHEVFNSQLSLYMGNGTKNDKFTNTITADLRASGPELQQVLGFRMARGRYFDARDTPDSQPVAVVNRAFAKLYEPGGGDISKFWVGGQDRQFKIVGVIDDFHQAGIADAPEPELDLNAAQMRPEDVFYQPTLKAHVELVLRSDRDAKSLVPELNHVMRQFNPDLAGAEIRTMDQIVEDAMGSQILAAHLLEALGGLALLVALAGLYSLLAYLVTLRTRELGLRLALGAQREDILSLVLRGAGALLLAGTAIGVGVSLAAARLLRGFLFGVKQNDVPTLVAASALLLVVGTFAAWLPARRASRLEPMEALRTE